MAALGETFSIHEYAPVVQASLLEPLPALPTMIRSCDTLEDASFGPIATAIVCEPPPRKRDGTL
jgi:hypothetical protein